jgi:hypothetical protein
MALNSASGGHAGSSLAEQETTASWRSIGAQSIKSHRSSNEERRPTPELPNANASCPIQRCDMLTSIHYQDQGIKNFARRPLPSAQRFPRAFSSPIESVGDSRIGLVLIQASGRRRGLARMARSLSVDLRRRVVDAIEGGLSCRAAAQRFGVSASSAIRWRAMERREGDVRPKRQSGDRHSQRTRRMRS